MTVSNAQRAVQQAHVERQIRAVESDLLVALGSAERSLDALENLRFVTQEKVKLLDLMEARCREILSDPTREQQARRKLFWIKQKRREYASELRTVEQDVEHHSRKTHTVLRTYHIQKKGFEELIAVAERLEQKQSKGPGLLTTLGQILFAWRMSNAFDDLAKSSGRRM